jgi:hypothetical protein
MKKLALALMVLGVIVIGLAGGNYASSDSPSRCISERQAAVDYLSQATAAGEGTPESQELVAKAQESSDWADMTCATADKIEQQSLMIAAGGLLLLVIGVVLKLRAPKA